MSAPWRRACPRPRPHPRPRPLARMGCLLSLELLSQLVDVRRYIFTDAVVFSSLSCVCCTDGGKRSARCIIAFCTPGAQQLLHLSMSLSSFLISRSLWYWQIPRSHSQHAARSRAPAGLQHPLDDAANNKNNRPSQHRLFIARRLWSLLFVWLGKCNFDVEEKGNITRVCFTFVTALELFLKPGSNTRKHAHVGPGGYPQ